MKLVRRLRWSGAVYVACLYQETSPGFSRRSVETRWAKECQWMTVHIINLVNFRSWTGEYQFFFFLLLLIYLQSLTFFFFFGFDGWLLFLPHILGIPITLALYMSQSLLFSYRHYHNSTGYQYETCLTTIKHLIDTKCGGR